MADTCVNERGNKIFALLSGSGNFGELPDKLDEDRAKVLGKTRRRPPPETHEQRLEKGAKLVSMNSPHGVSRCTNLILGHGLSSLDNAATLQQMVDKHPRGSGPWPKYVRRAAGADDLKKDTPTQR